MVPTMTQNFKDVGVDYSMGGMTGATMDSHRLACWAKTMGLPEQDKLMEQMFDAYFSKEQYLGNRDVLLQCAEAAGLDRAAAAAVIDDPKAHVADVESELQLAR